jgi:hypothetical protein
MALGHRLPRARPGTHRRWQVYDATAKLDAGEEELNGGDADRQRRLDSTTVHQQQLQQRPGTPGTRRRGLAAPQMFPRERGRKKSGDR